MCVKGTPEMTGYRSKKMMSDVRWLGPYAPADRHADDVTITHVVELRRKVTELEDQLARTLSWVVPMKRRVEKLEEALSVAIEDLDDLGAEKERDDAYAVLTENYDAPR